jgi:malate/lactate dehydrogenase
VPQTHAPDIPRENFTALTRLDQNRAVAAVAKRAGVSARDVSNVIIWGNHSSTQYPDARFATLAAPGGVVGVTSRVEESWLRGAFVSHVQQRGAEVIKARGASSAGSAAAAICAHVRDWLCGASTLRVLAALAGAV